MKVLGTLSIALGVFNLGLFYSYGGLENLAAGIAAIAVGLFVIAVNSRRT